MYVTDKKSFRKIKLDLYDILEIDTTSTQPFVRVEPLVTMGQLTAALNPLGWTVAVLPELDDLTVGGLIAGRLVDGLKTCLRLNLVLTHRLTCPSLPTKNIGVGVESSSHKFGLFQHICRRFEVALADGTVTYCSPDENPQLFYNIPWSHGTLGFLLSAEIKIVRCKPFVRLRYFPFKSSEAALEMFERESRKGMKVPAGPEAVGGKGEGGAAVAAAASNGNGGTNKKAAAGQGEDTAAAAAAASVRSPATSTNNAAADIEGEPAGFVEALVYSPEKFVVMLGDMLDAPKDTSKINAIGNFYKPWFFKHVEGLLDQGKEVEEYVPLRHYYHRHSKSLFWEIQDIIPFGNHPVFRYLFGWMMPPRISLLKLTQTEALRKLYEEHHVVQDMLVPVKDLSESLDVFEKVFRVYPLWLCPMRIPVNPRYKEYGGFVQPLKDGDEMFVDIGAYGNPTYEGFNAKEACRKVENFVREKKGYQMMYADSYMTREEFRQMFAHGVYDKLRAKMPLCLKAFPEVYDKVSKQARI